MIIALIFALFFAMNIGASGTAASMGAAYGGGALHKKWLALILVAGSVFLGAAIGGGEVVRTIAHGLIPSRIITVDISIMIIAAACFTLFIANMMAIPLSTSEVTVGAVVGVGLAYRQLYLWKIAVIMGTWLAVPFVAFLIALLAGRLFKPLDRLLQMEQHKYWRAAIKVVLVLGGCYEAFSAGMNNVANAVGPLVGANLIGSSNAVILGGSFVAVGVILLGGRVLDTNAKKITKLTLLGSSTVSFTSGSLILIASLFGIPVPLTQTTTMAIFGIGTLDKGMHFWRSDIVKRVLKVWIASPILSLAVSYALVQIIIFGNLFALLAAAAGCITIAGYWLFKRKWTLKNKTPVNNSSASAQYNR